MNKWSKCEDPGFAGWRLEVYFKRPPRRRIRVRWGTQ